MNEAAPLVYFITAAGVETFPVKVGRSSVTSLRKRVKDLQTAIPYEVEILFLLEGGGAQERNIHHAFADHRMKGEWFNRTTEFMRVLDDVRSLFPNWRSLHPLAR